MSRVANVGGLPRVFRFCAASDYAQAVFMLYGVEPFEAALHGDARLLAKFHSTRYPQMPAQITRKRSRR